MPQEERNLELKGENMSAVEKLIKIAQAEIGYLEKETNSQLDDKTANAGNKNFTKYARDLDQMGVYNGKKNGYAWCDMFVDWCFIKAFGLQTAMSMTGQKMGGYGAGCTESARYYKNTDRFFTSNPKPGDQIFFTKDNGKTFYHTGLVVKVENGRIYTIEGNTSSLPGVVENGGAVRDKSYSLTYNQIGGFGCPNYSLVKDDESVSYEEWKEYMDRYRSELQTNDANVYSKEARDWAVKNGVIAGGDAEKFNGMWRDFANREQMVTVIHRALKVLGLIK